MPSRVASRTTRASPCWRRKAEICSAGDPPAIAGAAASNNKTAVALPTARWAIIPPRRSRLTRPERRPPTSPSAIWTLQGIMRVVSALLLHMRRHEGADLVGDQPRGLHVHEVAGVDRLILCAGHLGGQRRDDRGRPQRIMDAGDELGRHLQLGEPR